MAASYYPFASLASQEATRVAHERELEDEATGSDRDIEEVPYYEGPTFDEIDWDDADFDDVYDDVGDEEEEQYGEDAT